MTLRLANIVFDCDDTLKVAHFWAAALDLPLDEGATENFASIALTDPTSPSWFFARVPEPKTAKNRCHVDLHTEDRPSVQTETDRLVALGATVIRPPKEEYGTYWSTLQDPEGNELCIGAS